MKTKSVVMCNIADCLKPAICKGMCNYHYRHSPGLKKCRVEGCQFRACEHELCHTHGARLLRHGTTDSFSERRLKLIATGVSLCSSCHKLLPVSEFSRDSERVGGIAGGCKRCKIDEKYRSHYKITLAEYEALLQKQNGKCAICGAFPGTKRLALDHNHKTGRIRGILCTLCNRGIGHFLDSAHLLTVASRYVAQYEQGNNPDVSS